LAALATLACRPWNWEEELGEASQQGGLVLLGRLWQAVAFALPEQQEVLRSVSWFLGSALAKT